MSRVGRAVAYRLFAGDGSGSTPMRFRRRIFLFAGGTMLLSWVLFRTVPHFGIDYSGAALVALSMVMACLIVNTIHLLAIAPQQSFLERLNILDRLPLHAQRIRRFQVLAYVPLYCTVGSIALSVQVALFGGNLHLWQLYLLILGALAVTLPVPMLLHTTQSRLRPYASPICGLFAGCSLVIGWGLVWPSGPSVPWMYVDAAAVLVGMHLVLIVHLIRRPAERFYVRRPLKVHQHTRPGIYSGLGIRATRSRRYVNANLTLVAMAGSLCVLSFFRPTVMPFTGVMAISLLLAGTLGQESRALSRQPTAFELVRYSRFIPWLLATWIVTFINVAIFIDALLVIGIVFFSHSTGPDHVQILSTAACLTAAACCAGSLVVPYRRDILAQLFSTAVYGVLAWGIFRVLQTGNRLGITLMIVGICLGTALLFENMRWRKSIRGKYVFA